MTARDAALTSIIRICEEGAYANITVRQTLLKTELSAADRGLYTELVYGVLRYKNTLEWILQKLSKHPLRKLDVPVRYAALLGLYQLRYLDRIPPSAAVNEAVRLAKARSHAGGAGFVNAVLRNYLRRQEEFVLPDPEKKPVQYLSLQYGQPEWLAALLLRERGAERTESLLAEFNRPRELTVRVNTLRTSIPAQGERWQARGIAARQLALPEAFAVEGTVRALQEDLAAGYIYVQDPASMYVAHAVAPVAGERVLDVCAAPGGKSMHLAALMRDTGRLVACDVHEHKLALLRDNAARLGVHSLEAVEQDATIARPEWYGAFDRVLVDAPCSGLGVIGRRPDVKWRRQESDLAVFPPLQAGILAQAAEYVAPGGRLVYSTCTLRRAENEDITAAFLAARPDFSRTELALPGLTAPEGEITLWPPESHTDGFYICSMTKENA